MESLNLDYSLTNFNREKIAVIIRVYLRISDCEALIHIIRKNWVLNDYEIFVVHNGEEDGHQATQIIKECNYIRVISNSGHRSGAKDLVKAALQKVSTSTKFTKYIFIESDCWVLDDKIVLDALNGMKNNNKFCASYIWVPKRYSFAVDFFVIDANFANNHPELFEWDEHPERYFSRLASTDTYLLSSMELVHAPSILNHLNISPLVLSKGRFRIFPKSLTITHHLEEMGLENNTKALEVKKGLANTLTKKEIFKDTAPYRIPKDIYFKTLAQYIPQKHWLYFWRLFQK